MLPGHVYIYFKDSFEILSSNAIIISIKTIKFTLAGITIYTDGVPLLRDATKYV